MAASAEASGFPRERQTASAAARLARPAAGAVMKGEGPRPWPVAISSIERPDATEVVNSRTAASPSPSRA